MAITCGRVTNGMSVPDSPRRDPVAGALPATTLTKLRRRWRANGPRWFAYHVGNRGAQRIANYFARKGWELEIVHQLPGWNTVELNRAAWSNHDWSRGGEEWTESPEWAQSLVEDVMYAELPAGSEATVLEIGPGAGRWTMPLYERSASLILADLTDRTLSLCRERLGDRADVSYVVTDGRSLPSIASGSIDFIWSFDVFVHIAPADTQGYIVDFARIMRPEARGIVHHAGAGNIDGGWRSSMTADLFARYLEENGLKLVRQFQAWGPDGRHRVPHPHDMITVFERP